MHADSYQTSIYTKKIATIQLSFSSPFCTKFIYNVYINVPWWDYGKNVCTTDALLRNKVNVLKINLLQFLLSFFELHENRKWCTDWLSLNGDTDAPLWQLCSKHIAFWFPCLLLPASLRHCLACNSWLIIVDDCSFSHPSRFTSVQANSNMVSKWIRHANSSPRLERKTETEKEKKKKK